MNKAIFEILVCPCCNGKLKLLRDESGLICSYDKLHFVISDGIPMLLPEQAAKISSDDIETLEFK